MAKGRLKGKLPDDVVAFFKKAGKKGGKLSGAARMEKMSPEQRTAVAKKASAAAAVARSKKAKAKKARRSDEGASQIAETDRG